MIVSSLQKSFAKEIEDRVKIWTVNPDFIGQYVVNLNSASHYTRVFNEPHAFNRKTTWEQIEQFTKKPENEAFWNEAIQLPWVDREIKKIIDSLDKVLEDQKSSRASPDVVFVCNSLKSVLCLLNKAGNWDISFGLFNFWQMICPSKIIYPVCLENGSTLVGETVSVCEGTVLTTNVPIGNEINPFELVKTFFAFCRTLPDLPEGIGIEKIILKRDHNTSPCFRVVVTFNRGRWEEVIPKIRASLRHTGEAYANLVSVSASCKNLMGRPSVVISNTETLELIIG